MDTVTVERLSVYSDEDAAAIGRLMHALSSKFPETPVSTSLLTRIIESPSHDQLVARIDGHIVGCATLTLTLGAGAGPKAYLEDFIVDPEIQGKGIGSLLWEAIGDWCREHDADLFFTSRADKEAAHRFYLHHGATVYDSTIFKARFKPDVS